MKLLAGQQNSRESDRAAQACNDWLRLGPGRSLPELAARYKQDVSGDHPPVASLSALKKWSTHYGWAERAREFDARDEERKTTETAQRRHEVMEEGLALDFERVASLKKLAGKFWTEIERSIWIEHVTRVGRGKRAHRVVKKQLNVPLVEQFRRTLEDLAKETGGRITKIAPTTPDGKDEYTGLSEADRAERVRAILALAETRKRESEASVLIEDGGGSES